MILLWGSSRDRPIQEVRTALQRRAVPFCFLDQEAPAPLSIVRASTHVPSALIAAGPATVELSDVTSAYLRPHEHEGGAAARLLHAWADVTPAPVINRPAASWANNSKPYQASLIARAGFDIPETLITTDEQAIREFRSRHRDVVYKSISGVRSIVRRLADESVQPLDDVRNCPTQFQEYVPGEEYRIHLVGHEIFACRIDSDADDYRYASGTPPRIASATLDAKVRSRVESMVRGMGLLVAGVDVRRHPDGRWFCFEVNPSPAFSYYEAATGQPIADAIARLLAHDE